jgi:superfamily II DNA or RNA helicase
MIDPRDKWQRDAFNAWMRRETPDFLASVATGAGKTRFGLMCAREFLDQHHGGLVIVVVPTVELASAWNQDAHTDVRLDLDATITGQGPVPSDRDGLVYTYDWVVHNAGWLAAVIARRGGDVMIILDEVHHAATDASWGRALAIAFQQAKARLLLSGTAWRHKGDRIIWVQYTQPENDEQVPDPQFSYSLSDALADRVVLPAEFQFLTGIAEFGLKDKRKTTVLDENLQRYLEGYTRRTVSNPWIGKFVKKAFMQADAELTEQRKVFKKGDPVPAGIIFAPSIPRANAYAALMTEVTGEPTMIVHQSTPEYPLCVPSAFQGAVAALSDLDKKKPLPVQLIEVFRSGNYRWIVAVQMISEGVDIPRLQVGVYLSGYTTRMAFIQMLGRLLRLVGPNVDPKLFIPRTPASIALVETVTEEQLIGLEQAASNDDNSGGGDGDDDDGTTTGNGAGYTAYDSSPSALADLMGINGTRIAAADDIAEAQSIKEDSGNTASVAEIAGLLQHLRLTRVVTQPPVPHEVPAIPGKSQSELRQMKHNDLNRWVRTKGINLKARGMEGMYPIIWTQLRRDAGCRTRKEPGEKKIQLTLDELLKCEAVIRKWRESGSPWD